MFNKSLVIRLVVVRLTDLVVLIIGREQNGWDGAAWHGEAQLTIA